MKKKKFLSKGQFEGLKRNFKRMSRKIQKTYLAIIGAMIVRVIKAKLGFTLNTGDGNFAILAKAIFDALTADTGGFFTPAFADLALLGTQITDFKKAVEDVKMRKLGSEGAKKEAKLALKITLDSALAYVNNIASHNLPNAEQIITSANMKVIDLGSKDKQDFTVKQGSASGEIRLIAKAVKINGKYVKTTYEWQWSTDNGATWTSLDPTTKAKTTAMEMKTDVKTLFRKRYTTVKGGTSAWCVPQAITPV